jgi:hypothetical protein
LAWLSKLASAPEEIERHKIKGYAMPPGASKEAETLRLRAAGHKYIDIACTLGVPKSTVGWWCCGVKRNERVQRGGSFGS